MGMTREHQLHLWSKISPNGLQLCKSCSGLFNPWQNLCFGAIIWNNCSKVLEACYSTQLLSFYLYLSGCHWRCLSSVWTSLHWSPSYALCRFCRDFLLGFLALALPQLEHLCHLQTDNISATYANLSIMFFQSIRHEPFEKNVEEGGWQKTSLPYFDCCSEPFSNTVIHMYCTCSLVIELLNGAN